jgi:replicative DNA helicase
VTARAVPDLHRSLVDEPLPSVLPRRYGAVSMDGRVAPGAEGMPRAATAVAVAAWGLAVLSVVIIVAARPALGKSTLALDFCRAASIKHDMPAIFFSLEMGRAEIAMRLLSAEASVPLQIMRKGQVNGQDWTKIASTRSTINDAPFYIDDSPNMTLVEIRAKCRRLKQKVGLKLVVIDYLQLMTSGKKVESRQQEVSEFSRALKLMAKELQVPVIALSQLNRGPEQRADKKPAISDLRESGSLEQDADMVILLHREGAYEKDNPRAGESDFIVAKHPNGPTATITASFLGHFSRFADMPQA